MMTKTKRLVALTAGSMLALSMTAGPVAADSHGDVAPHDHMITTPGNGKTIQVGPDICKFVERGYDKLPNQRGHNNFHNLVHQGDQTDQIGRGSDDGCDNPRY